MPWVVTARSYRTDHSADPGVTTLRVRALPGTSPPSFEGTDRVTVEGPALAYVVGAQILDEDFARLKVDEQERRILGTTSMGARVQAPLQQHTDGAGGAQERQDAALPFVPSFVSSAAEAVETVRSLRDIPPWNPPLNPGLLTPQEREAFQTAAVPEDTAVTVTLPRGQGLSPGLVLTTTTGLQYRYNGTAWEAVPASPRAATPQGRTLWEHILE